MQGGLEHAEKHVGQGGVEQAGVVEQTDEQAGGVKQADEQAGGVKQADEQAVGCRAGCGR